MPRTPAIRVSARGSFILLTPERLLRWSLGFVYLWFGLLKLVNTSPAVGLIRGLWAPLATIPFYCGLTAFEKDNNALTELRFSFS